MLFRSERLLGVLVLLVSLHVPTGKTDRAHTTSLVEAFKGVQQQFPLLPYTFATTPSCLHDNGLSTAAPQLA